MLREGFLAANNLQHNVAALTKQDDGMSLMALAERYVRTQAADQVGGTTDAKQRDLACVLQFYVTLISERVKAGMAAARTWGKRIGRPATSAHPVARIETLTKTTRMSVRQIQKA